MEFRLAIILLIALLHPSTQANKEENKVKDFAEAAASLLKEQNTDNIADVIGNLIQSEGANHLRNLLLGDGDGNSNQLFQALGSVLGQFGGDGGGFNPALLRTLLSSVSSGDNGQLSVDVMSLLGSLLGKDVSIDSLLGYVPTLINSVNSFAEEAKQRAGEHSGHAWFVPPILEKLHVAFDVVMNSDLGKVLINSLGSEKFVKALVGPEGKFSSQKFTELLENHSFRKYWIELVTRRIAAIVSYLADPEFQESLFMTGPYLLNNFLTYQGFPKKALFDPARPTETISALTNYVIKKYLNYQVSSKQYIKPLVKQVKSLIETGKKKGYLSGKGIDTQQLSQRMADTINLEIIEPVAKVYRAYRFTKKHPHCDKYVFCLVNQDQPNDSLTIPGLKTVLSKSSSMLASFFLGNYTGEAFLSLSGIIFDPANCQGLHVDSCDDYHIEETKVTTEYVHSEL